MKILLLFSIVYLSLVNGLDNDGINMVVSFATMDGRPTSVLAPYVCWSAYELTSLAKNLRDAGINTAASLQPNRPEYYLQNLIILADLSCKGTDDFLTRVSDEKFFKSPYRWLLLTKNSAELAILDKLAILVDSDVVLAQKMDQDYHFIEDSNETRKHMDDRLNLHQDSITKMSYMAAKICLEMMNATEKLLFTNTWGYVDKNGSWNGIVEKFLKDEADIGTLMIFTQERMRNIDYIAMIGSTAVRFVFREPPLAYVSNIYALPFTGAVWLASFICVLACALFMYITSKWEATMGMHPLQLDGSWADVLILTIGAVLQQGCTLEPRHAAGRVVTLLLFFSLTILYAAYSANIVVLLRAPSSSVRSLQDILNSPLKLGASDFAYNRYFFTKLNDPLRKEIYNKKIAPKGKKPNFYTMKEGVEKIRKGLFAFHMELNPGYRLIQETFQEDEKCDLVEIDYINEIDPWLPAQRRSPYKDLLKINFIKIRESGIQASIHQRLHVGRPRCLGAINTFSSVGIMDMASAILATLYGMLLAPAVLLLEISYKRLMVIREKKRLRPVME
uniref:Ionotropic receptor IR19 n=1 Tax=Lobesia botrana TaxID=209534 RepID=A0A345BF26_9NEOP|nr:ionotropic receptor IR19 [Lobesia botrana]